MTSSQVTFIISKYSPISSYACAISDGEEVVITGGFGNRRDVTVYSMSGLKRNLADLNVGRQYHACSRFTDQYGQNVRIFLLELGSSVDDSYSRHCWWPEVSQGWRTRNPRRSSHLEPQLGHRAGSCHIQAVNLERPM